MSVLAFGDFYQLPPVKGKPLFINDCYFDLWNDSFKLVNLTEIMRQKEDKQFAELLNRCRIKKKKEHLSTGDRELLLSRENDNAVDALHIFPTNAQVNEFNAQALASLCSNNGTEPIVLKAEDNVKQKYSPRGTNKANAVKNQFRLLKELQICVGARIMLIYNIDITDGLVNGAFGTVTRLIDVKSGNTTEIKFIEVSFDNKRVGKRLGTKVNNENRVIIERVEEMVGKDGNIFRKQFPLKLAWACSVHKVQGLTVCKAVVSLKKIFQPGQAYVALSRVTSLEGLTLQDFNEKSIYSNPNVQESLDTMPNFLTADKELIQNRLTILYHNIEGLHNHSEDLRITLKCRRIDFICLVETWVTNEMTTNAELDCFSAVHQVRRNSYTSDNVIQTQAKGGVCVFRNIERQLQYERIILPIDNLEYIAFKTNNILFITLYRPSSYAVECFLKTMKRLLVIAQSMHLPCLIMGDFNQNISNGNSSIRLLMEKNGFNQLVTEVTTDSGTLIDHVYVKDINVKIAMIPTYYSYHEALELTIV